MCSCFGGGLWAEFLREGVSSPSWWAAGGRPRLLAPPPKAGFSFFFVLRGVDGGGRRWGEEDERETRGSSRSSPWLPLPFDSAPFVDLLRLTGRARLVGVRPALGLKRAREFVKAFSERGGDLHVTERQHRQVRLVPLHQPEGGTTWVWPSVCPPTSCNVSSILTCDHSPSAWRCSLTLRQQLVGCVWSLDPPSRPGTANK